MEWTLTPGHTAGLQCEVLCSVLSIPYVCWCRHIRSRRERLFLVHTSRCLLAYRVIRRRRQTYVATTTAGHWPHHRELMYQRQQHQLQQHSTQRRLRLFLHQFRRHLETVLLPAHRGVNLSWTLGGPKLPSLSFPYLSLSHPFPSPRLSLSIYPLSNLVHFSLKIWHLVATMLMIFLGINCPNLGQFKQ